MNKGFIERLADVDLKVRKLVQKLELVRKENELLIEENISLKQRLNNIKKETNKVASEAGSRSKEQFSHNTLSSTGLDSAMLREELDKYIREVQDCIDQLQS
jgi:regulator of replication initiation timing